VFVQGACIQKKPGCDVELTRAFEQEVLPLFRREKDFRVLIALILPDETRAFSLSLRDQKASVFANRATRLSSLVTWREWSWEIRWLKSMKSRNLDSTPSNPQWVEEKSSK
jgi:hypothetical protein